MLSKKKHAPSREVEISRRRAYVQSACALVGASVGGPGRSAAWPRAKARGSLGPDSAAADLTLPVVSDSAASGRGVLNLGQV